MIRVHNGVRTRFWKDRWTRDKVIARNQELFPDLFDLPKINTIQ